MDYRKLKRLLDQIVVVGKTKRTFFRKSKDFELQIYYIRNKIMIVNINGVEIDHPNLGINIEVGGSMDLVFTWIEKNKHEITFQRNRLKK